MTIRKNVYSGTVWESQVAYSRAVRLGSLIVVAGTVSVDKDGNVVGHNDIYQQTKFIFEKIREALGECGATLGDVIRTRAFVTDISMFDGFAKAHQETFNSIDPVSSCIEISRLISSELLIEIEVDAYLAE